MAINNQADHHKFCVHCLSKEKSLKDKKYTSVNDIKQAAFALYNEHGFTNDNAILTYFDDDNHEHLLDAVPALPEKGHSKDLFIGCVHLSCAICSNPFGVIDDQLLFQCTEVKCGEQYCNSCVETIQRSSSEHLFACISCKKNVVPHHNTLIQEHIIWKNMGKLYGTQSLLDLKLKSNNMFCHPIQKNIDFRLIHLQSRLNTFQNRIGNGNSVNLLDQQLVNSVNGLCGNLEDLVQRIKQTDEQMEYRGIVVNDCVKKYKDGMKDFERVSDALIKNIEKLATNDDAITMTDDTITMNTSVIDRRHIKQLYSMKDLDKLPSEQNIKAIDDIFKDLSFRKRCLSEPLDVIKSLLKDKPQQVTVMDDCVNKAKEKLTIISIVETELTDLRGNLRAIERFIDEYDKLLQDDKYPEIPCSKFILLMEMLRVRTEELDVSKHFPKTFQLKNDWQNDYGTGDEFKPKVIELFKSVELDVQHLLSDGNSICSLPYKIGVIGNGSVGKSALTMNLVNVNEFSSMVDNERSTFSYLQFDTVIYKNPENDKIIPVTFVDIEGATDTDESQSTGNYLELITKADCDLYIIVFDKPFDDHNRICQQYIEEKLVRKCLLVRSKVDLLFNSIFQNSTGKKYKKQYSKDYRVTITLNDIKNQAMITSDDGRLINTVYLTAADCDHDMKDASFASFDLDKLKDEFVRLAIEDFRVERICKLAIRASKIVINTCFRRGCIVSKTLYRWLAAATSIIPVLDELPAFLGRRKIRQVYGIEGNLAPTNADDRTIYSFEKFLMEKKLTVPKKYLKSGRFKYLKPKKTKQATTLSDTNLNNYVKQERADYFQEKSSPSSKIQIVLGHAGNVTERVVTTTGTLMNVMDDVARVAIPISSASLRVVSTTFIILSAVTTPAFAAWAFYNTGRRMNNHVHLLCDDLIVILAYSVIDVCNKCCHSVQLLAPPPSDQDSESDNEESEPEDEE